MHTQPIQGCRYVQPKQGYTYCQYRGIHTANTVVYILPIIHIANKGVYILPIIHTANKGVYILPIQVYTQQGVHKAHTACTGVDMAGVHKYTMNRSVLR